jgi:hypothetical protein
MHLRQVPFPVLMLLGCVTLVWAVKQPRRSPETQQASPDDTGNPTPEPILDAIQSWTGVVSDSNCAAQHETASGEAAKCVAVCVASGAHYVLVTDDTVYQIGPQDKFSGYAGQAVNVRGSRHGDTILVTTVSPVLQRK